jgi:DNA-binding PadR family transcriptional regulator
MALLVDGPQHGYALVDRLKDSPLMKGSKPDDTGVYRLLNSLEEQGLVRYSVAESELGPSKRIYELTTRGAECLGKWTATLDEYQQAIAKLVAMMRKAEAKLSS